jgi:hypothetical protein
MRKQQINEAANLPTKLSPRLAALSWESKRNREANDEARDQFREMFPKLQRCIDFAAIADRKRKAVRTAK